MSQINTTQGLAKKWLSLSAYVVLVAISFSCAKKQETVRAVKKTESIGMNPVVTAQSQAQVSTKNFSYNIVSVNRPTTSATGFTIDAEIQTPDNQFMPITTTHDQSGTMSQGSFQDSARGAVVVVQAQCLGDGCLKYLLLVSVTKNNIMVYQSAAISFKDDLKFYFAAIAEGQGNFFKDLTDLSSYGDSHNFVARTDCTEKDCPAAN